MTKEEAIEIEGGVQDVLPNTTFRVQLSNWPSVFATITGKKPPFRIPVRPGIRRDRFNCAGT